MFMIHLSSDMIVPHNYIFIVSYSLQQQHQQVKQGGQDAGVSVTERKNWESDDSTLQAVYKSHV